jgi:hypothetical protein
MLKSEFERLALRGNATIGVYIYRAIERYYMSDDDYHRLHGGPQEDKRNFVKRVFGGKVNTPRSITRKLTEESIRENRWFLRSHNLPESRLKEMDRALRHHFAVLATCG